MATKEIVEVPVELSEQAALDDLAEKLFIHQSDPRDPNIEKRWIWAYRAAVVALKVRGKVRRGEVLIEQPIGVQLADHCAPNLLPTHPWNLIAKVHTDKQGKQTPGDLKFVEAVNKWLIAHREPRVTNDVDYTNALNDQLMAFRQAFPKLAAWTFVELNIARKIYPSYCPQAA